MDGEVTSCRSCGQRVVWGTTEKGRRAPFNASDGQNHFVTCPQRREWRRSTPPKAVAAKLPGFGDESGEG